MFDIFYFPKLLLLSSSDCSPLLDCWIVSLLAQRVQQKCPRKYRNHTKKLTEYSRNREQKSRIQKEFLDRIQRLKGRENENIFNSQSAIWMEITENRFFVTIQMIQIIRIFFVINFIKKFLLMINYWALSHFGGAAIQWP